ncbi:MAG: 2-phospho-L-lactate guanylyltransferase [Deltaproteobacteria bacterium]|nr:2-phospho-L-lactate guanylyltransferase [Deltaproteobacteria bacterium]
MKASMNCVLVPVKALAQGKTRLSTLLSPEERHALSRAMLTDVVTNARRAIGVDRVVVVSSDPSLLELAHQLGADPVDEGSPRGLNGAVAVGTEFCLQLGATAVLVLLADLPLVMAQDVERVFQQIREKSQIVVVPCKEGDGTNALLRTPPEIVPTRFGGPSLEAHRKVAHEYHVACQTIEIPRIAFDVDSSEDLRWLASQPQLTQTLQVLQEFSVFAQGKSQ